MNPLRAILISGAAALTFSGFAAAPAFAGWDPDPYSYNYSPMPAVAPSAEQTILGQPRADTCFLREPVRDNAGNVIGHRTVDICSN